MMEREKIKQRAMRQYISHESSADRVQGKIEDGKGA